MKLALIFLIVVVLIAIMAVGFWPLVLILLIGWSTESLWKELF